MKTEHEKKSLQNFASKFNLQVHLFEYYNDRRKKPKFLLVKNDGLIVSPKLDYKEMNHYLLGINNAKKYQL